jgi:hypothetical protein
MKNYREKNNRQIFDVEYASWFNLIIVNRTLLSASQKLVSSFHKFLNITRLISKNIYEIKFWEFEGCWLIAENRKTNFINTEGAKTRKNINFFLNYANAYASTCDVNKKRYSQDVKWRNFLARAC